MLLYAARITNPPTSQLTCGLLTTKDLNSSNLRISCLGLLPKPDILAWVSHKAEPEKKAGWQVDYFRMWFQRSRDGGLERIKKGGDAYLKKHHCDGYYRKLRLSSVRDFEKWCQFHLNLLLETWQKLIFIQEPLY